MIGLRRLRIAGKNGSTTVILVVACVFLCGRRLQALVTVGSGRRLLSTKDAHDDDESSGLKMLA